jgi:hypothetical protein
LGFSEVPWWSLGEFARWRECFRVLNAFPLDRRSDNFDFYSDVWMRAKAVCVDERHLARAGVSPTPTGA